MFSIIIPTYNRENEISNAIYSALNFFEGTKFEILIIDDCSTDKTLEIINNRFKKNLENKTLKLIINKSNCGVNFSRSEGIKNSNGEYLVLLDSDDELVIENKNFFFKELGQFNNAPLIFFRCKNERGDIVGDTFKESYKINLQEYVEKSSSGEVLIVINKKITKEILYDIDLYGYEGLAYLRVIQQYGAAINSKYVMRLYKQLGDDRLSSKKNFIIRLNHIVEGHIRFIKEFGSYMSLKKKLGLYIKIYIYQMLYKFKDFI